MTLLRNATVVVALAVTYKLAYEAGRRDSEVIVELHDTDDLIWYGG